MNECTAGFETGTLGATVSTSDSGNATAFSAVTIQNGALVYDNAHVLFGTKSAKVSTTASTPALSFVQWSSTATGTLTGTHYGRGLFYFTANPSASVVLMALFSGATQNFSVTLLSSGKLQITDSSGTNTDTSTTAIPLNAGWRFEYQIVQDTTNGIATLRIFTDPTSNAPIETLQISNANVGTSNAAARFGILQSAPSTGPFWMDGLDVGATDWPGPLSTTTLLAQPIVTGTALPGYQLKVTTGTWSPSGSFTYNWQRSTDLMLWSNTGATTSYYNVSRTDLTYYLRCVVTDVGNNLSAGSNIVGPARELGIVVQLETTPLAHFATRSKVDHDVIDGSTPIAFGGTFVDISPYALEFHIRRGKQRTLGRFETGTMDLTLLNNDRRFDPSNTAGPYAATLVPYRLIRLGFVVNGQTHWQYTGFVERWPITYRGHTFSEVQITCVDALAALENNGISAEYAGYVAPGLANKTQVQIQAVTPGGDGNNIQVVLANNGASQTLAVSTTGNVITVTLATDGSSVITSTAGDVAQIITQDLTASALVTITAISAGSLAHAETISLSGGKFPAQLSGARFTSVLDQILWWSDKRAIDTGHITIQAIAPEQDRSTTALDHLTLVADTEQGFMFSDGNGNITLLSYSTLNSTSYGNAQVIFVDGNVQSGQNQVPVSDLVPKEDVDLLYNDVRATRVNGTLQTATNSISNSQYFDRVYTPSPIMNDDVTGLAYAQQIVAKYGTPTQYFDAIKVIPALDMAVWTTLVGLELGDTARVVHDPPGGGPNQDDTQTIINIDIQGNAGPLQNVIFTFQLDQTDPTRHLIYDDATQGHYDKGYTYGY